MRNMGRTGSLTNCLHWLKGQAFLCAKSLLSRGSGSFLTGTHRGSEGSRVAEDFAIRKSGFIYPNFARLPDRNSPTIPSIL